MSNQHEGKKPIQMAPMAPDDDVVGLLELWRTVTHKKWVVLGSAFVCTLAGVAYSMLTTPVYETEAYFLPPAIEDFVGLNVEGISIRNNQDVFTQEIVYNLFLQNVRSRELRRKFFKQENLFSELKNSNNGAGEDQVFEDKFNKELVLNEEKIKRGGNASYFSLRLRGQDASRIADLTNRFVAMVMSDTRDQLVNEVVTLKDHQIKNIEKDIASKRRKGALLREDESARLMEALEIAKKLKITEDKFSGSDVEAASAYNIGVSYLRGIKTLSAQIESLQNRKSDDPFILDLRKLQADLDAISAITIIPEHIKVARIDQPALVPDKPIKPRKGLVVALSGLCGLLLGIFTAFFLSFVQQVRKEEA